MGNPKRRFSKARTRSRRANWKAEAPAVSVCPRCHEPKLPHRVCGNCGWYDGQTVVNVEEANAQ